MEYGEVIDRLNSLVGKEVSVYLWSDSGQRDVIAGLTGTLQRAESDAGRAAQRARIVDQIESKELPREAAEEHVRHVEELFDAARQAHEAGEPLPDQAGFAIVATGTGRREHFTVLRGDHPVGDLWISESEMRSADYDRWGLSLRCDGAMLTFMNVYRPRRRQSQR